MVVPSSIFLGCPLMTTSMLVNIGRETTTGRRGSRVPQASQVPSGKSLEACDDHDIRAVVANEVVKVSSRFWEWCTAATGPNHAFRDASGASPITGSLLAEMVVRVVTRGALFL